MLARKQLFRILRAMLEPALLRNIGSYFVEHPKELLRIARNAAELKLGVPLPALRWLLGRANSRRGPTDVSIEAVPPGIRVSGTLELMGARLRGSALVFVQNVQLA